MIRINELFVRIGLVCAVLAADSATARDRSEAAARNNFWSCGASLLPCRIPGEDRINTLPYWRGNAPTGPIRATYTPAFPRTPR